jgi:hypothetical protein
VDIYKALDKDTQGIDAIGRPAHGNAGFKVADDEDAIHGVDEQGHDIEAKADTCITRSCH